MRKIMILAAAAAGLVMAPLTAIAAQDAPVVIVIKDHKFTPAEIRIPAGKRVELVVDNQDPTPEEFESHDLNLEKVIAGGKKASIWVGPVPKGVYNFVGEFHEDIAKGRIIVE